MSLAVPVIDYIDGPSRKIFLKQGVSEFHPVDDIYAEYRHIRKQDLLSLRKYKALLKADGNINKGGGKATPRYVTLFDGAKIVPFDENAYIFVTGECITDNPDVDPDIFFTDELTLPVKVYYAPSEAEIIYLSPDGGSTDVNIISVNGVNVSDIDDFKADLSSVYTAIGAIPQNVWEYTSQTDAFATLGLTTEQEAKLNEILSLIPVDGRKTRNTVLAN